MTCKCRKGSTCAEHLADADLALDSRVSSLTEQLALSRSLYDELFASQARDRADYEAQIAALVAERVAEAKIHARALEEIVALREREQQLREALDAYGAFDDIIENVAADRPDEYERLGNACADCGGEQP